MSIIIYDEVTPSIYLREGCDILERLVAEQEQELAVANERLAKTKGKLDRARARLAEMKAFIARTLPPEPAP